MATFVKENRDILGKNISHVDRVAKVLVKQRAALDETLKNAPMALNNLALTYNPQAGTLDTNANLGEMVNQIASDPQTLVCGFLGQVGKSGQRWDLEGSVLEAFGAVRHRLVVRPAVRPEPRRPSWPSTARARGGGAK